MAKSKRERLGKEFIEKRIKQKRKLKRIRNVKIFINKLSIYFNVGLLLYIAHLHGELIPFLTNIYDTFDSEVIPFVEGLINKLSL
jgi:DNA/RNA-binding domain of Phe-tRNA-synthetase-like protein